MYMLSTTWKNIKFMSVTVSIISFSTYLKIVNHWVFYSGDGELANKCVNDVNVEKSNE